MRFARKHRTALLALAVYNFVFFFPVAFMGRAVSPNDVFYNFAPWSSVRPEHVRVQNALLNDPPTSYYTLFSLVKDDWRTFHWNPYIASGVPGFGSSAAASLTPFVLLPVLLVPLAWSYTAMLFLKLNVAFFFAYLWLREERLGKRGAAIGAIVIAGAGIYSVRWLWQITNATALYPALLWVVRRTFNGRRIPMAIVALIALAYALAGFPAAMAYGAYLAVAYAIVLAFRRLPLRDLTRVSLAVIIALFIAAPALIPFAQFLRRSGYLDARRNTSLEAVYPISHARSLIAADRLGNPAYKNWIGDKQLGVLNNYVEATIYLGILPLLLALIGLLKRRWFWLAAAVVIAACMFGAPLIAPLFAKLPGFKYSALARVALLLPLPIGYLAAAGAQKLPWRRFLPATFAMAIACDLALVAGRFHPFLEPKDARVPSTPVIDFLRAEKGAFRVAAFFDYFWPNAAELFRVEDVRSHFSSEGDYRRMLQRLEPGVWGGQSTVLQLNSLQYQFGDPLAGMLGIRYYLEHKPIDIVKWTTLAATVPAVTESGPLPLRDGVVYARTIVADPQPFWAIELSPTIEETRGARPFLEATLLKENVMVWSRRFTPDDIRLLNKIYIPLRPYARAGERVTLRVRSVGIRGFMRKGENANAAESPMFYGRVTTPVIFDRELPDGRVFRNLSELPRFWPVRRLRKLNHDEFLAARDVDYESEAVITDAPVMPPSDIGAAARVTLAKYEPHEQRVVTDSSAPFFLASSEKLTPELAVTLDGKRVRPTEINMLFAGLRVPAGKHEIVFSRRIARGWWWVGILGVALWIAVAAFEVTSSLRRHPSLRRRGSDTRRGRARRA